MIYLLREVIKNNNNNSFITYIKEQLIVLYSQLSLCNNIKTNDFLKIIGTTNIYVYMDMDYNIYGVMTLLFEKKIIHDCGIVCHIEDVVVGKQYRNKQIGSILIKYAIEKAKEKKCYKIILDCNDSVKPFYINNGFEEKNKQMAMYF